MDDDVRDRLRGIAAWLDASPSEVVGVAVLLVGGLLATGVLWWSGRPVPVDPHAVVAPVAGALEDPGTAVEAGTVTVHVAGAVARPGLVEVAAGARVADALAAAGGVLADAEPAALNLAREVTDGERLDVPRLGQAPAGGQEAAGGPEVGTGGPASAGALRPDGTLDLNRATVAELESLPGVGPVTAERIVGWREANGGFTDVAQLREVTGIGEKRFQALVDLVGL